VELLLRNRIVLVIVTNRAARRQSHENRGGSLRAVNGITNVKLFINGSAFAGAHVATVKSARDFLVESRVWQKVAGQLLDGEFIEWLVAVKSLDDPISIGPERSFVVQVQTVGIAVT